MWFGRQRTATSSGGIAKQRLQCVLVGDRVGVSPDLMVQVRGELAAVLSRYMDIDETGMDVRLSTSERQATLDAHIPVRQLRRGQH